LPHLKQLILILRIRITINMKKLSLFKKLRYYTAGLSVVVLNLNVFGKSFKGICSPGFNCHGCPWASTACPVGVFAFGSAIKRLPLLALSTILFIGIAVGRLVCGFFCPFGFLQDLLNKIPLPKFRLPRFVRYFKYAALLLLVFLFPFLLGLEQSGFIKIEESKIDLNDTGDIDVSVTVENISEKPVSAPDIKVLYVTKEEPKKTVDTKIEKFPDVIIKPGEKVRLNPITVPNKLKEFDISVISPQSTVTQETPYKLYFCKLCPKGALTASLPNKFGAETDGMYSGAGWFSLKFIILYVFIFLMLFSKRPFCRILCPLGAIYGLTSKLSLLRLSVDHDACIKCGACDEVCPVEIDVLKEIGGPECIACGDCIKICPVSCIKRDTQFRKKTGFKSQCSESGADVVT
jgi:ferredoxin